MNLAILAIALCTANPAEALTYSRDIAPIFVANCQDCHRPGEAAPMSLLTYEDVRPHARNIRKHVEKREMPPWHADPAHGEWKNDRRLADEDIKKILAWVDAGAPEGDKKDLPPTPEYVLGWTIGKPDVIFKMPEEQTIKAKGEVPYKYFTVDTQFTDDKWIQAAEARPGNRAVVHHIIVFIQEAGKNGLDRNIWKSHLCGTAPGEAADVFPPGTAKLVKAGSKLLFQMHYTPTGKVEKDQSSVGLIFATRPVEREIRVNGIMNTNFRIPAGANKHQVRSSYTIKEDSTLWALMPHMHLRGKDFKYEILYPDGRRDIALSVPRWDFNWQHNYLPKNPIKLPAGTKIECTAHFDNSADNKANPDPAKDVRWGDQTWEEMMIGFVTFTRDAQIVKSAERTERL